MKQVVADWIGYNHKYPKTLAASNHTDSIRSNLDYYATEPRAVRLLLELEKFDGKIWECACGEGHLSKEMISLGYDVKSSDIVDRGFGEVFDFLSIENQHTNCNIITNPPYRYATEFIYKSLEILETGKKAAFFLPIRYLEGKERKKLFDEYPPIRIYVSSSRLVCAKNGDFANAKVSAVCYAWFVWQKGFVGNTTLMWFN